MIRESYVVVMTIESRAEQLFCWPGLASCSKCIQFFLAIYFKSSTSETFDQSNLRMRIMEANKIDKRAKICKCYNKSQLAALTHYMQQGFFLYNK